MKMVEEIELWVCPHCHVLQGIETLMKNGGLVTKCVNCGTPMPPEDVKFLNLDLVKTVIRRTEQIIDEELHHEIRYSWVANKSVGIIFEFPRNELQSSIDPVEFFEEELGPELGISITVFFEN